jgi:hypothetical protein
MVDLKVFLQNETNVNFVPCGKSKHFMQIANIQDVKIFCFVAFGVLDERFFRHLVKWNKMYHSVFPVAEKMGCPILLPQNDLSQAFSYSLCS